MSADCQSSEEQYFYRTVAPSRTHRFSVSAYLVERLSGSTIVARIEPLGLWPKSECERELESAGRRRALVRTGPWCSTPSRHHVRARVGELRPSAP